MILKRQFDSSSSDAVYTAVIDTETGASSCNCKGWTFKRPGRDRSCKHTVALRSEYGFGATLAPKPATPAMAAEVAVQWARAQEVVEAAASKIPVIRGRRAVDVVEDEVVAPPVVTRQPNDLKPMLASAPDESFHLDSLPADQWVMEEKYDGHRMIVRRFADGGVDAWSRPSATHKSNERELPPHIVAAAKDLPIGIYDGELYAPAGSSCDVKRVDRQGDLALVLFDVLSVFGQSVVERPYHERRPLLEVAVAHTPAGGPVRVAERFPLTRASVEAIWSRGGEGAIVKRTASTYEPGRRSPDWVKVKLIQNDELTIVGFEAGKRGPRSIAVLRSDDGRQTTIGVPGNDLVAEAEAHPERFLGRRLVIEYRGLTPGRIWKHASWQYLKERS